MINLSFTIYHNHHQIKTHTKVKTNTTSQKPTEFLTIYRTFSKASILPSNVENSRTSSASEFSSSTYASDLFR